ncbi:MAG: aminotransferase class III-fold pyridoxal phosphate-dependent enzyme [Actinomycetota bacterium]
MEKLLSEEDARYVAERPETMRLLGLGRAVMPNGVPMSWHATDNDPPIYVAEGRGSRFRDVDGHEYVDFNVADMSMFCGYAPEPIVRAVSDRVAKGVQFLLPSPDAIDVATELARRWPLPQWQFTLSASQANVEAIRLARVATGRDKVVWFDGKYHGHFDDALVTLEGDRVVNEQEGLPRHNPDRVRIVPWNDPDALERALAPGDVALVLTEPALTNTIGLLVPAPGFHDALRSLTRDAGTLLCFDETHTLVTGPGGLIERWALQPDIVTAGKSVAAGIPMGTYGMTAELAELFDPQRHDLATGGTLFGNPLQMAAAKAALTEILTEDTYERTAVLGARLADGIEQVVRDAGLEWTVHRLWARSGTTFGPRMPRDAEDARAMGDPTLTKLFRRWLANRGVWEAIAGAGPTVSAAGTDQDIDRYVGAYGELVAELTR